ncbi:hypothetical protein J5N97_004493 [Dioscorea zingiberensis]|uniref:Uncharacterized protein n=1 Tax=Dioscorea zingiberensis TaxID=325984 RepID=A0A9D5D7Z7_9LILI|nr:hypothetical protein J5N97_004493 [Dioscorea zingiberensis]
MGVMEKLKIFVVQEPVVAASCLIAGFGTLFYLILPRFRFYLTTNPFLFHPESDDVIHGEIGVFSRIYTRETPKATKLLIDRKFFRLYQCLFLPAVVRPILDSFDTAKQVPQPALSDVVAGMTGKKGE